MIVEDRNLHGEALCGRAYARQKLATIATALERADSRKSLTIDISNILTQWAQWLNKPIAQRETLGEQAAYAFECAKLCHTEAEISENRATRSILIALVPILVAFAGWLDTYPSEERDEKV